MRFIGNIETNVGQVVKDLETIAKNHPDEVLTFRYYDFRNYNDNYVSGVRFLKELGFLLLESSLDEDDALTVKQLIKELKSFDSTQKIVAQDGWRLVNLEHNIEWDSFFESDESSVIVLDEEYDKIYVGSGLKDIRLHSLCYLMEEMKDRFGNCQDLRIVCLDENDEVYPLSDYHHDEDCKDGCDYLYLTDENGSHAIKVSDFINLDYVDIFNGVAVNYTENGEDYVLHSIEIDEDGHSFFKTNIDGEDVIACRLGDIIRSDDIYGVVDAPGNTMTKDDFIVYLKDYYVPHLKALIEEDEEIAGREEDEFDCEFEDDEYVEHIAMAEGRARAMEKVVRELEALLKKID